MKKRLEDFLVVIPLHLSLDHPSDYISQTARILASQNKVIFFDFVYPFSWKELIIRRKIINFFSSLNSIFDHHQKTIYFRPIAFLPGQKNKLIYKVNRYLGIIQLRLILSLLRKKIITWSFNPLTLPVLKKLGEDVSIYDCVDALDKDEKKLLKMVDIISFNSKELYEDKVKKFPFIVNKSIVVPCGCSYNFFCKKRGQEPKELTQLKGKKIILAGTFDYRLDFNLFEYLLKNNPNLNFILIGPVEEKIKKKFNHLFSYSNLIYLGVKKKPELLPYYQYSDLGIIPYNTSHYFVKYANPMKAYEYLACGLPIVSTKILSLINYPKDVVFTTDDKQQFSQAVKNMLSNWNEIRVVTAKKLAKNNRWENKIKRIEEFTFKKNA